MSQPALTRSSPEGPLFAHPMDRLVRPSVNTGIQYRQDLVQQNIRSLSDSLGLTRAEIKGHNLLYHDKPLHPGVVDDRHMKRITSIRGHQRADYSQTGLIIEQRVAHDKRRTTSFLFVTGLRVKGNGGEVSFFRNVPLHLPDLTADRFPPICFSCFIVFRYSRHEFL